MRRSAVSCLIDYARHIVRKPPQRTLEATLDVTRELASHCAVLTLELEKAYKLITAQQDEIETLRGELAQQRRVATVVAFPVARAVRKKKQR